MIKARVYSVEDGQDAGVYLGTHKFLALPRPGDILSIWRKLDLVTLSVVGVAHHGAPEDPRDDPGEPPTQPSVIITARLREPPED